MKHVDVVGAAIVRNGRLFAAKRPDKGEVGLKWEFPGGKIEEGESPEEALVREIREELSTDIEVEKFIAEVSYTYTTFHLSMKVYLCRLTGGEPVQSEHVDSRWLKKEEVYSVEWAPADYLIMDEVVSACFS
ncbi:MAG: (deoxy)nucleoside triphosphate pyrophosphohydrolase [Sphaerochaetaceae bacterium]|nr:(deoxy)nucleoside triphosphate pyrophosphohydrolase [Sphaerochaetaceae bacterium]